VLRRIYDATWGRAFALGYDFFFRQMEEGGLREMRSQLLSEARGRCLEIGAGTGLNLERWPGGLDRLVLSEPDPHMARQLRKKVNESGRDVEVVEAPGEALPFEDASFDTVALTLVLCTAPDPAAVLREVARLLAPGGRFLFMEHVRAEEPGLANWQDRLHGPWYVFADGCHCNREALREIEGSPLQLERSERGELPKAVPLVRPMVRGAARAV
jgi:ubiquinone/menaquinone biosynthesis C-methylase UbiE